MSDTPRDIWNSVVYTVSEEQRDASMTAELKPRSELNKRFMCHTLNLSAMLAGIEMIDGPMFAGKSTELIRRVRRYRRADLNVFIITSILNTRSKSLDIETHEGERERYDAKYKFLAELEVELQTFKVMGRLIDIIAIDEAQFFDDVAVVCNRLADQGYRIVTAGCATNFQRQNFGNYYLLALQAESVTKLTAVCHYCKGEANYSVCLKPKSYDASSGILIGGSELYHAACRACYLHHQE